MQTITSRKTFQIVIALSFLIGMVLHRVAQAATAPGAPAFEFVITVQTDKPGTSSPTQFTIPTIGVGYEYNVDCDSNGTNEAIGVNGDYTCSYSTAGTYFITINGYGTGFPRIYFNNTGDAQKLLTVEQWGVGLWTSMESAFAGCSNLTIHAPDDPDLSYVTDMSFMFLYASSLNQDIGSWDTSGVTNMDSMFEGASAFNQNIGGWDVAELRHADDMFTGVSLSTANYDALLTGWDSQALQYGVSFSGGNSTYCAGEAARTNMIGTDGWIITDGGQSCSLYLPFIVAGGAELDDGEVGGDGGFVEF